MSHEEIDALALSVKNKPEERLAQKTLAFEVVKFLHGEEIKIDESIKGYTLVCVNGISLGFGKASNGNLKNKYPKGLRNNG